MTFDPLSARPARGSYIMGSEAAKTRPGLARRLALAIEPPAREAVAMLAAAPHESANAVLSATGAPASGGGSTSAAGLAAEVVALHRQCMGMSSAAPSANAVGNAPAQRAAPPNASEAKMAADVVAIYRQVRGMPN